MIPTKITFYCFVKICEEICCGVVWRPERVSERNKYNSMSKLHVICDDLLLYAQVSTHLPSFKPQKIYKLKCFGLRLRLKSQFLVK